MEMWEETCPVIMGTKHLWKDEATKPIAKQYWKKRSYIFQGFVVDSPLVEGTVPENPIRRFTIGQQIFGIVEKAIMDPEFLENPCDLTSGVDFRISSEAQGTFSNYSSSSWARRPRSLNEQELVAIEQFGLWNLSDYQGEKPDAAKLEVIKEMLKDSLDGLPFDVEKYGPAGFRAFTKRGAKTSAPVAAATATAAAVVASAAPAATVQASAAPASAPAAEEVTAPVSDSATAAKAQDVMARIQAMRTAQNG
jgi:hypothetical protein